MRYSCDLCGSNDNLCQWEYEGKTFQQCKTPGCANEKAHLANQDITNETRDIMNENDFKTDLTSDFIEGEYKETRGLTEDTCRQAGIQVLNDKHIFKYQDAQKIRIPQPRGKKKMYWEGNPKEAGLFLEHLEYDFNKSIIITEGEIDAASLIQCGYQSYSVRTGASGAFQDLKEKLESINKYKEIIFWFDSDTAGKNGLKKVLELEDLDLQKVRIIESGELDANDLLIKDPQELHKAVNNSKEYIPEGLFYGSEYDFNCLEDPEKRGISYPFALMEETYRGLREGEILLIGAGSGSGKTLFSKVMAQHWAKTQTDLVIGYMFLEENVKFTIQSLLALDDGIPSWQLFEKPYKGLADKGRSLFANREHIFDNHFGSLDSKKFFQKLTWLSQKADLIILDHISIVVSGMESSREGERKDIDRLMTTIKTLSIKMGCRFVIISHLRRPSGEYAYENGAPVTPNSFRGSHSLYQLSNSVIALERNQQDGNAKNKVVIRGLKNRFKGDVGILDELYYNEETGQLNTLQQMFK